MPNEMGLVFEAPCIDDRERLFEQRIGHPHQQHAIIGGVAFDRQVADVVERHDVVVVFRGPGLVLLAVRGEVPRRVRHDHRVLLAFKAR